MIPWIEEKEAVDMGVEQFGEPLKDV